MNVPAMLHPSKTAGSKRDVTGRRKKLADDVDPGVSRSSCQ